ncbi:DMT family transporter [Bacillus daqingensis]|uniref:DMT family transporter n=1 Tax=Bacillus daqingensis TaxID=872396 RepID=A0ABV9NV54_9BACI
MKYVLLLVLASFFWAGNFVIGKELTAYASPGSLTLLRYALAVMVLLPLVWWKERQLLPPKAALLPLFLMGVTGVVLFNLLQFLALANTTASNVGVISTLNTFSIAICAVLLLKERITLIQAGAMIVSFAGACLVITNGSGGGMQGVQSGDLWMLAAVGVFGIYSICSRWATSYVSPMMSVLYSGIIGVGILLPVEGASFAIHGADSYFVGAVLYISLIATILCMVFWGTGVKHLGASTAGLFMNLNPVFTVILAFILLGEQPALLQIGGTAIVIAGCLLYSYASMERKPVTVPVSASKQTAVE